jgi:hypothetical protein
MKIPSETGLGVGLGSHSSRSEKIFLFQETLTVAAGKWKDNQPSAAI